MALQHMTKEERMATEKLKQVLFGEADVEEHEQTEKEEEFEALMAPRARVRLKDGRMISVTREHFNRLLAKGKI